MTDLTKDDVTEQLELMVDRNGLLFVLTGLVCVCDDKSWDRDAALIEKILEKISN